MPKLAGLIQSLRKLDLKEGGGGSISEMERTQRALTLVPAALLPQSARSKEYSEFGHDILQVIRQDASLLHVDSGPT